MKQEEQRCVTSSMRTSFYFYNKNISNNNNMRYVLFVYYGSISWNLATTNS